MSSNNVAKERPAQERIPLGVFLDFLTKDTTTPKGLNVPDPDHTLLTDVTAETLSATRCARLLRDGRSTNIEEYALDKPARKNRSSSRNQTSFGKEIARADRQVIVLYTEACDLHDQYAWRHFAREFAGALYNRKSTISLFASCISEVNPTSKSNDCYLLKQLIRSLLENIIDLKLVDLSMMKSRYMVDDFRTMQKLFHGLLDILHDKKWSGVIFMFIQGLASRPADSAREINYLSALPAILKKHFKGLDLQFTFKIVLMPPAPEYVLETRENKDVVANYSFLRLPSLAKVAGYCEVYLKEELRNLVKGVKSPQRSRSNEGESEFDEDHHSRVVAWIEEFL